MKHILYLLLLFIIVFNSCKEEGCTNQNSFNYNSSAEEDDGSCKEMYGCLGFASDMTNSGTLGVTTNNQYYDIKMNEEVIIQKDFFSGIPASVFILYEPSAIYKNAYATTDGRILFGYHMFYYTIASYGELPVAGILAHEFGHRVQFIHGWNDYSANSHRELEADAFSGFYMALRKQWAWSQIQNYYANVYATGDYNFNHTSHHGTPQQRLAAANFGVQVGADALQSGTEYTYLELHTIFNTEIKNNITASKKIPQLKEVKYPENITEEYIRSLFPVE
ncbi:MAG: hypothetical protein PHT69_01315 [Bacteroidales bacterium]|nr:hypothetical protein [Bacteroidales bacterium]